MEFDLTDELIKQITFAMENQTEHFLLDSKETILVKKDDVLQPSTDGTKKECDQSRYYRLPEWNSILGFKMMEKFVSVLKNPMARSDLKQVLALRKGVFRNFKDTLSGYPEVEKLWYSFRDGELKKRVLDWYNRHRSSWGLDLLPIEFDETDSLILEDFSFRRTSLAKEFQLFNDCHTLFLEEILEEASESKADNEVITLLWERYHYVQDKNGNAHVVVAETVEGDFAGIAVFLQVLSAREKTILIPFVYVDPAFRGLGLASELLQSIINYAKEHDVWKLVAHNVCVPDVFSKVLLRNGFKKRHGVFFVHLLDF